MCCQGPQLPNLQFPCELELVNFRGTRRIPARDKTRARVGAVVACCAAGPPAKVTRAGGRLPNFHGCASVHLDLPPEDRGRQAMAFTHSPTLSASSGPCGLRLGGHLPTEVRPVNNT